MKSPGNKTEIHLPRMIENTLEANGILYNWASEDYRSKRSYDITTNSATISTIHSVKGLDYSCVFLVGLDFIESGRWSEEQINKLTYVAMTRARDQLFIPFMNETPLVKHLKGS